MSQIPAGVTELVTLLDHEQACLEALGRLLDEEQRAARALLLDRLTGSAIAKTRLLGELDQLARRRAARAAALAAEWGLGPDALSLTELAARVSVDDANRLRQRRERLQAALCATLDANRFNGLMIARICRCLEERLSCWCLPGESGGLYSGAGAVEQAGRGRHLVEWRG